MPGEKTSVRVPDSFCRYIWILIEVIFLESILILYIIFRDIKVHLWENLIVQLLLVRTAPIDLIDGGKKFVKYTKVYYMETVDVSRYLNYIAFQVKLRNSEKRARWVKAMKRVKPGNSRWSPCASDRVCSVHFIDGISTPNNPDPSQNLGYHGPQMKPRRTLFHHSLPSQSGF